MVMLSKLLRALGFKKLIHLNGVSFENLTDEQVALMIEASIFQENDLFDYAALHEFMLIPNESARLERIRRRIVNIALDNSTAECPDGLESEVGRNDLRALVSELRLTSR
jgi:hypothetical protein